MEGSHPEDLARAVLTATVTRDDVDDAMIGAGFRLVNVIDALPGRPGQLLFARDAGASYVYVIDDMRLGVTYLAATRRPEARAQGAPAPARVLDELRQSLACHESAAHDELLAPLEDGAQTEALVDDQRLGLGLALLVLTDPEAETAETKLRAALKHLSPRVRAAALTAITYAPKPGLLPALLAMQTSDPDASLREAAARVLESLFAQGASS